MSRSKLPDINFAFLLFCSILTLEKGNKTGMRTLIIFFAAMLYYGNVAGQKAGDKLLISEECNMYDVPSIMGIATKLSANDTITILQTEDEETGFYYVQYKELNGYINGIKIVLTKRLENPSYKKTVENKKREAKSLENLLKQYTSLYGEPDDSSLFTTDNHQSRTLVWRCVNGKSRTIGLKLEKGIWIKEYESVSDCF